MLCVLDPRGRVSGVLLMVALAGATLPMSAWAYDTAPLGNDAIWLSRSTASGVAPVATLASLTFTDVPFYSGVAVHASADLNGDGRPDLVSNAGSFQVWLGNGDGTLTSVGSPLLTNGLDVAIADLDGDGRFDAVGSAPSGFVLAFMGNGDGTFQAPKKFKGGKDVFDVGAGDLNGDGIPEIVGTDATDDKAFVLVRNTGGGYKDRVRYDVGSVPRAIKIADMNGDGMPDLVVANSSSHTFSILLGNGDTTFQPQIVTASLASSGIAPRDLEVGDLNGDGKLDVAGTQFTGGAGNPGAMILLGNGDGTLGANAFYPLGSSTDFDRTLDIGDLNQDGLLDVAVTFTPFPGTTAGVHILLGNGDGTFAFDGSQGVTYSSNSVTIVDMNGDGRKDVVTDGDVLLNLAPLLAPLSQSAAPVAAVEPRLSRANVYPNPVNAQAALDFNLDKASRVSVRLFDARGRLVRTLQSDRWTEAGHHVLTIGRLGLHPGVYMYRIDSGGGRKTGRFVVLE